jgi:hypothetical protein
MVFNLSSVGCVINSNNGLVCPVMANGSIDLEDLSDSMNILDMKDDMFSSTDWFDSLSSEDKEIVDEVINKLKGKK